MCTARLKFLLLESGSCHINNLNYVHSSSKVTTEEGFCLCHEDQSYLLEKLTTVTIEASINYIIE